MKIFWLLKRLNSKSILFNLKYLPVKDALRFPFFIAKDTKLKIKYGAQIKLKCGKKYPGMIRIGYEKVGIFDRTSSRTVFEIKGNIEFMGSAFLGLGSKISVQDGATLELGNNFIITAQSTIICGHHISFGQNCLLSWDITIMDTDFHKIMDKDDKVINNPKEIIIGDKVWIGFGAKILKGSVIGDNNVIAANSLINSIFSSENSVIGGNPSRILREDISWEI
jgi:acetyltransferase-like isoleucine patch superfamily enzyme